MIRFLSSLLVLFLGLGFDYYDLFDPEISEPLFIFGFGLSLSSLVLLVKKNTRAENSLNRFTLFWIVLSIFLILSTPTSSNTWMPLYSIDKEIVTWIMGILFAVISLGLIVWKSFKKA